jgi:hypothetical protein
LKPTKIAKRRTRGIPTPNPTPRPILAEVSEELVVDGSAVAVFEIPRLDVEVDVARLAEDELGAEGEDEDEDEDEEAAFSVILK